MKQDRSKNGLIKPDVGLHGTLRNFILPIVEFLGILVPGIIFIFALFPAAILPVASVLRTAEGLEPKLPMISECLTNIFLSPSMGTVFLLSVFSYVVGHLFFRQDPKIPDQHSFKKVRETIKEEGPVRLCENEKAFNKKNGHPNEYNLEFPYRYLYEYLDDRGMKHLANLVPWRGNDPSTYPLRTKHFINVLKVRLEFLFPYQFLRLQRNEAHVRLMSSMWYASNSLMKASAMGVLLGALAIGANWFLTKSAWPVQYLESITLPVFVLVLSLFCRKHIESFLHYQRIREIVFILETAYFAKKQYPEFEFFEPRPSNLKGQ